MFFGRVGQLNQVRSLLFRHLLEFSEIIHLIMVIVLPLQGSEWI
jgi:hypothetical protein